MLRLGLCVRHFLRSLSNLRGVSVLMFPGCGRCSNFVMPLHGCLVRGKIEFRCSASIASLSVRFDRTSSRGSTGNTTGGSAGAIGTVVTRMGNGPAHIAVARGSFMMTAANAVASSAQCNSGSSTPGLSTVLRGRNRSGN